MDALKVPDPDSLKRNVVNRLLTTIFFYLINRTCNHAVGSIFSERHHLVDPRQVGLKDKRSMFDQSKVRSQYTLEGVYQLTGLGGPNIQHFPEQW